MAGQHQKSGGGHQVTGGSTDQGAAATAFVSQQDDSYKMTTVYDRDGRVVKEVEYERSPSGAFRKTRTATS